MYVYIKGSYVEFFDSAFYKLLQLTSDDCLYAYYRSCFQEYLVFQIDLLETENIRRLTTFKVWIHTADFISVLSIF